MNLLLALFGLTLLAACGDSRIVAPNIGDVAPKFDTTRLDGARTPYPAAWAGKPLAISFWADWCHSCESEMKAVERVYQRQKGKGLEVLAVNVGQERAQVATFIKMIGVSYPILLDEKSAIARNYGVVGLPTTFFVDGDGVVRAKLIGEIDEAVFEKHAMEMLK